MRPKEHIPPTERGSFQLLRSRATRRHLPYSCKDSQKSWQHARKTVLADLSQKKSTLSAPLITIEVFQNQPGLHTTVFLSIDPPRLNHSFANCFRSFHSCHGTLFFQ